MVFQAIFGLQIPRNPKLGVLLFAGLRSSLGMSQRKQRSKKSDGKTKTRSGRFFVVEVSGGLGVCVVFVLVVVLFFW